MSLRVRVRLFAMQREIAGTREVELDLPPRASIEDAWAALVDRFPRLGPGRSAVRFARNGAYTAAETLLANGDELAMILPVSGGSGGPEGSRAVRIRILEVRAEPFPADIVTAPSSASSASRAGLRAPLRRARRPRPSAMPVDPWRRSSTRPSSRWRSR